MDIKKRLEELKAEFKQVESTKNKCLQRLSEINGAYLELETLLKLEDEHKPKEAPKK